MNQHTILQSNLLDIIFENRNKEYGAYTLRKSYNRRMRIALLSMSSLSLLLYLLFLNKAALVSNVVHTAISIPDTKTFNYRPPSKPAHKDAINSVHPKKTNHFNLPPLIADSININNLPATPIETTPSLDSAGISENNDPPGGEAAGNNSNRSAGITVVQTSKANKQGTADVAEIMPQYPGGIKALLDFLKRNLHAPEEVEGDEVTVKVKFVVDYDGKLESFDVVKSGGIAFDDEVLRVLKKMPLWIPGKSNGENVSVYYVVPVKFTSDF